MANKKRIKKGITSLDEQIKIHEEKMKLAKEKGEIGLEDYYRKEINSLKKAKQRREKKI